MKRRTTEEVIREIKKFLNGIGGAYDWDDFLCIPIQDQRLNAMRIECAELRDNYSPVGCRQYCGDEGLKRLEEIIENLRTSDLKPGQL
jgi:hypothetical protein